MHRCPMTPEHVAQIMDRHSGNHICIDDEYSPSSEPCLLYRLAAAVRHAWNAGFYARTLMAYGQAGPQRNPYRADQ